MPTAALKTKQELANAADMLATSRELIQYETGTYMPVDWETGESDPLPPPERRAWQLLSYDDKMLLGRDGANILFASESEIRNFDLMLRQNATRKVAQPRSVLIRTDQGLRVLGEDGELELPSRMAEVNAMLDVASPAMREALLVAFLDRLQRPVRRADR